MHNSDKCGVEVTGPHRSKDFIEISAVNTFACDYQAAIYVKLIVLLTGFSIYRI